MPIYKIHKTNSEIKLIVKIIYF